MGSLLPRRSEPQPGSQDPRVVELDDDEADAVFGALSSNTARRIVATLHEEPGTPSDLAEATDTSIQNVRYHLENLADAGLVEQVDTWYSSRGNEMSVYAPKDGALIVTGDEESGSRLRNAVARYLGGLALVGIALLGLRSLFDAVASSFGMGSRAPRADSADGGGDAGAPVDGDDAAPTGDGGGGDGGDGGDGGGYTGEDIDAADGELTTRTNETYQNAGNDTVCETPTPDGTASPEPAGTTTPTPEATSTPEPGLVQPDGAGMIPGPEPLSGSIDAFAGAIALPPEFVGVAVVAAVVVFLAVRMAGR